MFLQPYPDNYKNVLQLHMKQENEQTGLDAYIARERNASKISNCRNIESFEEKERYIQLLPRENEVGESL